MQYRQVGTSGLKVSPICLGALMFGDEASTATARRIVDMARDRGVNFIDTVTCTCWASRSARLES